MIAQIVFGILVLASAIYAWKQFGRIVKNIKLGKDYAPSTPAGERWRNVMLIAFGQKKMFKRWIPAIFHFFIYAAFLFTQIELIEILIDGLFGVHRYFAGKIGVLYPIIINFIELLSVGAFVGTVIFLARRNLLKLPRFHMPEMKGWPKMDGNLILILEIVLLIGLFTMNGTDFLLQKLDPAHYPSTGPMLISSSLGPALFEGLNQSTLVFLERAGWWLHIIVVFIFLNYLPRSKHLHIFFAFPNVYYSDEGPRGRMQNMPEIMNEVKSMMGLTEEQPADMGEELPEFGAKDIFDLDWKTILESYTCTECGRCTAVCPANVTGKKLSPRKIVMAVRDRAEEVGNLLAKGEQSRESFDDGKSLFDYIEREEIHACTTCNACVEACPVMINPMQPILELRRYEILTESAGPSDWVPMFTSVENSGSVWQIPDARDQWTEDLKSE